MRKPLRRGFTTVWPVSEFEVEVRTCAGTSVRRYVTRSAADIVAELGETKGPLFLSVDAVLHREDIEQDVSLGEMLVWINAVGMAWVRLLEHEEHNPRDPVRAGLSGEVGGFLGEPEGLFAIPAAHAITAEQASRLLSYWLSCGQRLPELDWS